MFAKRIKIDLKGFTTKQEAHDIMRKAFKDSEYYGSNLDALHDVLTTVMKDTKVILKNRDKVIPEMQDYTDGIIRVFEDSAKENGHLTLKIR
ncbi:MAG: barstar family protein [Clostridia bacterium]|jgi:RNAse (barnase) inhibitor barstar|nr:barstar family protein [Clostridia bacterium]